MSERGLRALERSARQGDGTDRARLLAGWLRSGQLSPEQLALAAYLRDPAATAVLGDDGGRPANDQAWIREMDAHGKETCVRVAIAALRVAAAGSDKLRVRAALTAAEAWVRCPCARHGKASVHAALAARQYDRSRLAQAAFTAASAAGTKPNPASWVAWYAARAVAHAMEASSPERVREGIASEVSAWVLGLGDPVRMRVAKRGDVEILPEDLQG